MSFEGLRVLSLESRRAAEIETLIRRQDGEPFVAPSVKERPLDDHTDAFRLLDELERREIEMLVLMTGTGLSFWRDVVAGRYPVSRADNALRKVKLLARGPKPSAILRPLGITPDVTIPEPNTWREIVSAMRNRPERKLAIQEYGRPNPEFVEALRALGIHAETFALYRWELPEDTTKLREAARGIAERRFDVVLLTSSIQFEHLLAIAKEEGVEEKLLDALHNHVVVASVGPIMTAAIEERGVHVDIVPTSPKMGALVKAASDEAASVLAAKRKVDFSPRSA
jgi:uroporphyrinogen-III synthase